MASAPEPHEPQPQVDLPAETVDAGPGLHAMETQDAIPIPKVAALDGRYRIQGQLGRGAMGSVHRAHDLQADRPVAIKMLLGRSHSQLERFVREAQIAGALTHPGIVAIHSANLDCPRPYLVLDLVEGARTLDEAAQDQDLSERVRLLRDAARALGHAHRLGVVHRDVKPANILVDETGRVRVADFGVALSEEYQRLTQTGASVGTPAFMAPEQIRAQRDRIAPSTDVWALGVTLYQLLCGALPFESDSLGRLAAAVLSGRPPSPRSVDPGVPPALDSICLRALSRAPSDRHADGDAFADALEGWLTGESRQPRRWSLAAIPAAGLAIAGAAWLAFDDPRERPPPLPPPPTESSDASPALPEEAPLQAQPTTSEPLSDPLLAVLLPSASPADPPPPRSALPSPSQAYRQALAERRPTLMVALARWQEDGEMGLAEDVRTALLYYRAAADMNGAYAMSKLGRELLRGKFVAPNWEAACEWLQRSAALNDSNALHDLGMALRHGLGVKRDAERGLALIERASRGGGLERAHRSVVLLQAAAGRRKEVMEFLQSPAFQGEDDVSPALLAQLQVLGGEPDEVARGLSSLESLTRGRKGHRARLALAGFYAEGTGAPRDVERAKALRAEAYARLLRPTALESPPHWFERARMLQRGWGPPGDMDLVPALVSRAAAKGHLPAAVVLRDGWPTTPMGWADLDALAHAF